MNVGVLALQGCVEPHLTLLKELGAPAIAVKTPEALATCERLILPGGESSTMLRLLRKDTFFNELKEFAKTRPVWGICAGAILLAREVINPVQPSLGAIPLRAYRNFYGSQLDSFQTTLEIRLDPPCTCSVDFIRAPHLERLDASVQIIAEHDGKAVGFRYQNVLATAFHTELGTDTRLHNAFLHLQPAHGLQAA